MAQLQSQTPQQATQQEAEILHQQQTPEAGNEMLSLVGALETALLPCLPARELQAIDRSAHPSHQIDVERHARDFMEAAKKLQLYFIRLQHQSQPSKEEALEKEIQSLEEELKAKDELIQQQLKQIQRWRELLIKQRRAHTRELERV
eukprot:TRINITY_DN29159_c0_g1_i1.p1 TRINITY_DN29159_c0_g1~~TRINITY_DN29159_c0_g1_i1.p1  ORF type:complete len:147 (+),score=41.02 TRINITY_DN29159_c0_g1_i1:153-593(+)